MAYVSVPKDLTKVKNKVAFNLTKRQIICFAAAAAVGLPFYFLTRNLIGNSNAVMGMVVLMVPAFLFAMYEQHGQPLEVILRHIVETRFTRPRIRVYETDNFYGAIDRDVRLKKEVNLILHGKEKGKTQAHQSGKKAAERAAGAKPSRQEAAADNPGNHSI